ncbi:TPA: phage terminase large subunit family protein [Pseudomonas aeruginosa]
MNMSSPWLNDLQKQVRLGLESLFREPPLTAVEWADKHFYLSSESSYQEGKWETAAFQVGILNAMGNDLIRVVNLIKSARVGYTKMLMANIGYKLQHKKRNVLSYCPTDPDAEELMKRHVESFIRDVPVLLALAPWYGKKHRDNTLAAKKFSHQKMLWCLGGKAARNYREKSPDEVIYDELSKFDADIEGEGSPTFLGDKRLEGATFKKSIRGSTPGTVGECQITKAAEESPHFMRFHIRCLHCHGEQFLKWGGKDCSFGIKYETNALGEAEKAWYTCEHNGCVIEYHEAVEAANDGRWICERTGLWTHDSMDWFKADGEPARTPRSVTFHIWTAYSVFTTWLDMVGDWLNVKGDREKLITFVNTTLGETWEGDQGEKLEWENLYGRREIWQHLPARVAALTGFIDTQDDRYEARIWAWAAGEEGWLVDRWILQGDPASAELRRKVGLKLHQQYQREDGVSMRVALWGWDSGGHYTDEVYEESKKHGLLWVIPTKGHNVYGKPIAMFPNNKNKAGVYLTMIGTDNAKELIYSRLKLQPEPGKVLPGVMHLPASDAICDESELKQLTAETKVMKIEKGQRVYRWDAKGRRNEALDCAVGALAMLRVAQQRFGLVLDTPPTTSTAPSVPTTKRRSSGSGYLKQRR